MTFNIEKPDLTGKRPEEALAIIDTWASTLCDKLNYAFNHLDDDNFDNTYATEEYVNQRVQKNYEDIRKYIVQEVSNG